MYSIIPSLPLPDAAHYLPLPPGRDDPGLVLQVLRRADERVHAGLVNSLHCN
jgi:hypothetical protein